ncbi:MAG: CPBP family intramembrane metalloprotease [Actinobacteria bacterium]|nr:CPBP family intramembrane metalloprotease [Actinomycetota bacterium]
MDASAAATRVRWGIPDVALAWVAGLIGAVALGGISAAVLDVPDDKLADDIGVFLATLAGQTLLVVLVLALVARSKGRGSLTRDFGLTIRLRDAGWLAAGVGLQIALGLALYPIAELYGRDESQGVVDLLEDTSGAGLAAFAVAVVLVAPLAEELLFRGALLRALLRRTTPAGAIFLSALVFALVHPLGDPEVGSVIVVPAILTLGVISGYLAVRSGNLSRSIMLHAGFNLLTVVAVIAD